MDIIRIITAVALVGGVGLLISIFLSIFGNIFKVETDPREDAIIDALPGNNCGGCGYAGCSGLAAAIVKGEAPVNGCPVGGENVAGEVAKIMGVEAATGNKMVAHVMCSGTCEKASEQYEYTGVKDCRMAQFVTAKGSKSCSYGCLGFGSCISACQFDAITILDGIAYIDKDKCKACGKCVTTCPKGLIEMIPYDAKFAVECKSKDKGPQVMKKCSAGCIGCSLCVKACESEAVTVTDFVAHIDQDKCISCGACSEKCPKKVIKAL